MNTLLFECEWKAVDQAPNGELDGYMSVFGNVDQGGDIVRPGAFRKTFADWAKAKTRMPLIADHNLSSEGVVGSVTKMREDGVGARIRALFSSVAKAQDIRTNMLEGHQSGLSFTYEPVRFSFGKVDDRPVRYLDEVKVYEATVTPFPMNVLATASAKADAPAGTPPVVWLDAEAFELVLAKAFEIPDAQIKRVVIDLAIKRYHPDEHPVAAGTGETPPAAGTADGAVGTDESKSAVDTAEDAAAYALAIANPRPVDAGPSDPVAYSQQILDAANDTAKMDSLEAVINKALGREPANA
jgi:HK97 family phage prohead protease